MKLLVYNATVLCALLRGAETFPLGKTLASCVRGFEPRTFRAFEGLHWLDLVFNGQLHRLIDHSTHHHSAPCRLVTPTAYQSHLPSRSAIYKQAKILQQTPQLLERHRPPRHAAGDGGASDALQRAGGTRWFSGAQWLYVIGFSSGTFRIQG